MNWDWIDVAVGGGLGFITGLVVGIIVTMIALQVLKNHLKSMTDIPKFHGANSLETTGENVVVVKKEGDSASLH